jgi:hypothetical protein
MNMRTGIHEVKQRDEAYLGRSTEARRPLAEKLEPRIEELTRIVVGLDGAPYNVWLADTEHLYDPLNDLRLKVEALQWLFRVAKHVNDDTRDRVIAMLCKSVNDLEIALKGRTRTGCAPRREWPKYVPAGNTLHLTIRGLTT